MSIPLSAPFELGKTDDNSDGAYDSVLGNVYEFPGPYGGTIQCRLVENVATVALSPKRAVVYKSGQEYKQVDGYSRLTNAKLAGVVDPSIAATVPVEDVFYVVEKGLTLVTLPVAEGAANVIAVNDLVGAVTAAASTGTTGGRIGAQDLTGATAPLGLGVANALGRALSAKTTANTASDLLVYADVK